MRYRAKFIAFFIAIFVVKSLSAQQWMHAPYLMAGKNQKLSFYDVQKAFDLWAAGKDLKKTKGIKQYKRWEWFDPPYTEEKRKLRETSLELCNQHFKTTHIVLGGFQDNSPNTQFKMDAIEIVNTIK